MAALGLMGCMAAAEGPVASAPPAAWATLTGAPTQIIAHRGASGLRPEHTIAAYELAIDQGADWIEPDLVMTKDGVLVSRHDAYLSTTTDVADRPEFAERRRPDPGFGSERIDWWVSDFTLAELKTLRALQPRQGRSTAYDGQFEVPTLVDVIALANERSTPERVIGVIPETKHPAAFARMGLDMVPPLLAALTAAQWTDETAPVVIQSFEPQILIALDGQTDVRLAQLVFPAPGGDADAPRSNIPLDQLAAFADAVGPEKTLIVTPSGRETDFIARAHALGLGVYPWTIRDDAPAPDGVSVEAELDRLFRLGADGLFTDFPGSAVIARDAFDPQPAD